MPLTLRYSVQGSPLSPAGFVGEYGRMMVDYRSIVNEVVLSASDYTLIATSLSEGRVIRLVDDTGRALGDFVPALAGGFDIATFTEATLGDLRVGFKPTQELLAVTRATTTFEIVPTVTNDPVIASSVFTYEDTGAPVVLNNSLHLSTSGLLRINGTRLVKGNTTATLSQYVTLPTPLLTTITFMPPTSMGAKYMEIMLTNATTDGITDTEAAGVSWTKLRVALTDNPTRFSEMDITIPQ